MITKMLENDKINFTTFQPLEDRKLAVVIRGVSQSFSEEEILKEIKNKIPSALRVHRMRNKEKIFQLVVVYLDRNSPNSSSIFELKS